MAVMMTAMVIDPQQLQSMDAQQLRALAEGLLVKVMDQNQLLAAHQQSVLVPGRSKTAFAQQLTAEATLCAIGLWQPKVFPG